MVERAVRQRGDARAAWLSLRIALVSATVAAVLGLAAGYVLARVPRFFGRTLFGSLVIAPMVMPEVVMGISMLLLFVGCERLLGGPERGFLTIAIAHITFSIAFVAVVVQARLADFDRSLEEAAMDLGATPWIDLPHDHPAADRAGGRLGLAARLHAVARRSDPDPVRRRRAVADPADARLFQRAAGRRSADQRAGHHRRGDRGLCADSLRLADAPQGLGYLLGVVQKWNNAPEEAMIDRRALLKQSGAVMAALGAASVFGPLSALPTPSRCRSTTASGRS